MSKTIKTGKKCEKGDGISGTECQICEEKIKAGQWIEELDSGFCHIKCVEQDYYDSSGDPSDYHYDEYHGFSVRDDI